MKDKVKDLSQFEVELLGKMNTRAMVLVQIEEILHEAKIPIDKNYLYQMSDQKLNEFLEMLAEMKDNRKEYVNYND